MFGGNDVCAVFGEVFEAFDFVMEVQDSAFEEGDATQVSLDGFDEEGAREEKCWDVQDAA